MVSRIVAGFVLAMAAPNALGAQGAPDDAPAKSELATTAVDVPLVKSGDFYFVDVEVNGTPTRFTLETGANFFAIGERLAQRLGLPIDTIAGPGGRPMAVANISSLRFGGAALSGIRAQVMPMFNDPTFAGEGLISLPALRDFVATIDLRGKRLHLERGALPAPNGRDLIAMSGRDPGGRVDLPITIGGLTVPAVVDTRSFIWLMLPDSLADRIPLASAPRPLGEAAGPTMGVFQMRGARAAGDLRVGEVALERPVLTFRNRPGVVIGVPFLEQLVVTIDQRTRRVRVLPAEQSPITVPAQPWEAVATNDSRAAPSRTSGASAPPPGVSGQRTMGFNLAGFPGGGLTVRNIVPGSSAEKSGLKEGDTLVEFDGTPVADMNPGVFRGAASRGNPVKVVVERDGKRLGFTIQPYVVP
jgi:hypothetical protein